MRALLWMRWRHLLQRTLRKARNLRPYLDWQAVVIYLYAAAFLLGAPLYYLLFHPEQIPAPDLHVGGLLLYGLIVAGLLLSTYRALFGGTERFPAPVAPGDAQFVLPMPVRRRSFLADRLLWTALAYLAEGLALVPPAWLLGRVFLPPWGWAEAFAAGGLYAVACVGAVAAGILVYGLPAWVRVGLRVAKHLLWGAGVILGWVFGSRGFGGPVAAPGPGLGLTAWLGTGGLPPAGLLVHRLLLPSLLLAAIAVGLALLFARVDADAVATDALEADQRRIARLTGTRWTSPRSRGATGTSLKGWWRTGRWAIAWRQLAGYRHQPWSFWPPHLFSLLPIVILPTLLKAMAAGAQPELLPLAAALLGVRAAAGLLDSWRLELRAGLTTRLMPMRPGETVEGWAVVPALAIGLCGSLGTLAAAPAGLWSLAAGLLLSLAAGPLIALLAMLEEWLAFVSLTGAAQGRQTGMLCEAVLLGAPAILGTRLAAAGWPAAAALCLAALLAALEALLLSRYLALQLAGHRE